MSSVFAMGGYAPYIWTAYGFASLVVGIQWLRARRARAQVIRRVRVFCEELHDATGPEA